MTPFQHLLGPVSREEFFDRHWQKQSLLIQNREDRAWPFGFDKDAFFGSLADCTHLKMAFENDGGHHKECRITADQAARMYEAGNTICATEVDKGNAELRRFIASLEHELWGGVFSTNAYLSPGNKGFGTHFDYHSVWVLQLEGRKRWWFGDTPTISEPLTSLVYPMDREEFKLPWYTVERPDESEFHEAVLEPGDLLYIPAGVWHKTRADEYSLSVTLGHQPMQAGKFIDGIIGQAMWKDEACRRHLPVVLDTMAQGASEEALEEALGAAADHLRRLLDGLTTGHLMAAWRAQVQADRQRRPQPAPTVAPDHPLLAALLKQPAILNAPSR